MSLLYEYYWAIMKQNLFIFPGVFFRFFLRQVVKLKNDADLASAPTSRLFRRTLCSRPISTLY